VIRGWAAKTDVEKKEKRKRGRIKNIVSKEKIF
jgi:hypothetical protein